MSMNELAQASKEKMLVLAYKTAVVDKNQLLLNIIREKRITYGNNDIYFYNAVISHTYFLGMTDSDAVRFLRQIMFKLSNSNVKFSYF